MNEEEREKEKINKKKLQIQERMAFQNCNLMGDRNLWLRFTHKVKLNKKTIWGEIKPFLIGYLNRDEK